MRNLMRKTSGTATAALSAAAFMVTLGFAAPPHAGAAEADAKALLKKMSDYMAAQKAMSFDFNTDLEVVTSDLQKLTFASSGAMTVERPDKIRATRSGGFADVELIFDGKTLTVFGKTANAYGVVDAPGTIEQLVDALRNKFGKPLPGADLLEGDIYDTLTASAAPLLDLGSGVIGGVECDHLAGRNADVDWQIWIAQGDQPYPCRYAVTSKLLTGSPQYDITISNWKAGDAVKGADFAFDNTTNAKPVNITDMADVDELPGAFAVGGAK
jgi:hypothetical protein